MSNGKRDREFEQEGTNEERRGLGTFLQETELKALPRSTEGRLARYASSPRLWKLARRDCVRSSRERLNVRTFLRAGTARAPRMLKAPSAHELSMNWEAYRIILVAADGTSAARERATGTPNSPLTWRGGGGLGFGAQIVEGVSVVGHQSNGFSKLGQGFRDFPLVAVDHAQIIVSLGKIGLQPERLLKFALGLGDSPLAAKTGPEEVVSFRVIGFQTERLAKLLLRAGKIAFLIEGNSERAVRGVIVSSDLQRMPE